jgi:hypothetical protein
VAVDEEVVRAFLEDGGAVPELEGSNGPISDAPSFVGAAVIGMANSSSVIGLGVGNHTGGGIPIALLSSAFVLLIYEGARVDGGWCRGLTKAHWLPLEHVNKDYHI